MLGELTIYSVIESQPVDSQVELYASRSYLFNTDSIIDLVDDTSYRTIRYKFNPHEDQSPVFVLQVTNTAAAIKTLADATPASTKIALSVFEDVQTFDLVTSVTAVTWNFNVTDIVWAENDPTDSYCRLWYVSGGNKVIPIIVDHNISQITDLADTATTTSG